MFSSLFVIPLKKRINILLTRECTRRLCNYAHVKPCSENDLRIRQYVLTTHWKLHIDRPNCVYWCDSTVD